MGLPSALALALLTAPCVLSRGPDLALAVTNGTLDSRDPAVVALEPVHCSGTLISPRVILTAAHCIWGRHPTQMVAFFGDDVRKPGRRIRVIDGQLHPGWNPATQENDLAVLLLSEPASDVAPVALLRSPIDDHLLGAEMRMVGFGSAAIGNPSSAGVKREGRTHLAAHLATTIVDAGGSSNTCSGDSGGPVFLTIEGSEYLAAVTSRGDVACRAFGVRTRIDVYLPGFVQPYIDASQPGAAHVGDRCAYTEQCATGHCLAASDSGAKFCSQPCDRNAACPPRMACLDGLCAYAPPSPGSFGSACDRDADCLGRLCASATPGGERACTVACVSSAARPCPPNHACLESAQHPGETVCLPGPHNSRCQPLARRRHSLLFR